MAGRLSIVLLAAMAVAALFQNTSALTSHVVGGNSMGWAIPTSGGAAAYANWAAGETFAVGDVLVFNFITGSHNVAEVTKTNFDACNGASPISTVTTSPANITLNSTGAHYFICTFPQHCGNGQKLAINVTASGSSPAPRSPATPSPASAPAPVSSPASSRSPATPPSPTATSPSGSPAPPTSSAAPPSTSTTPTTTTPSASEPTGTGATPPSPGNSAPSFAAAAGFSATFLSIAVALLY